MVADVISKDVFSATTPAALGPEKVQPVAPAKPVQTLPGDGKSLPAENQSKAPQQDDLDNAVQEINDHIQSVHRELQFSLDVDSGHTVIKVVDANTQEVIRQIPGEEVIKFARTLNEGAEIELINTYI